MATFEAAFAPFPEVQWVSPLSELPSSFEAEAEGEDEDLLSFESPRGRTSSGTSPVIVTVEGLRQGKFKGDSGKDDKIHAALVSYSVTSPRDVATGMASGKRQHAPMILRQPVNPSTIQFFEACFRNEVLKHVTMELSRPSATGAPSIYLRVQLQNATVAGVRLVPGSGGPSDVGAEIGLTFAKIELVSPPGSLSSVDDWSAHTV